MKIWRVHFNETGESFFFEDESTMRASFEITYSKMKGKWKLENGDIYERTVGGMNLQHICNVSGVHRQTLDKWYKRETKRPQFATIAAVAKAIGKTHIPLG